MVLFTDRSGTVDAAGQQVVAAAAARIRALDPARVVVTGYTDDQGNAAMNLALSRSRAAAVATLLRSALGSDAPAVSVVGLGEQQRAGAADDATRRLDRRVTVTAG